MKEGGIKEEANEEEGIQSIAHSSSVMTCDGITSLAVCPTCILPSCQKIDPVCHEGCVASLPLLTRPRVRGHVYLAADSIVQQQRHTTCPAGGSHGLPGKIVRAEYLPLWCSTGHNLEEGG